MGLRKLVSQKLGLHTVIYRPGDITGAANGIWEMDDTAV